FAYYLILSGDQLYRMDFRVLLHQHIQSGAEITLATKPVPRDHVSEFGIMQSGVDRRINRFVEKPKDEAVLHELRMSGELLGAIDSDPDEELFQASMGIYVFNRDVLVQCLENELVDFGKDVIPQSIKDRHVSAFIFQGYWEDIGTVRAFYEANLDLTDLVPEYSFFEAESPIYTHASFPTRTSSAASSVSAASSKAVRPFATASSWAPITSSSIPIPLNRASASAAIA
ncbi:MAG: hypothetical protein DME34_03895, partial [Verrucomicrobia bacterium]